MKHDQETKLAPRNAEYWTLRDPLRPGEIFGSGYRCTSEGAIRCARSADELVARGYTVVIEQRATIEHELPIEPPDYDPSQDFESERFVIIITSSPNIDSL